jgi:hypothetical protein
VVLQLAQSNLTTAAVFSRKNQLLTALQGILTVTYLSNFIDGLEAPTRLTNSNEMFKKNEMFENCSFQSQHSSAATGDVTKNIIPARPLATQIPKFCVASGYLQVSERHSPKKQNIQIYYS